MTIVQKDRLRLFRDLWIIGSKYGKCDARGGAEYRRVRRLYIERGYPRDVWNFLTKWANMRADGTPGDTSGEKEAQDERRASESLP